LSFAATSLPSELMSDQVVLACVNKRKKKERKLRSYLTRAVEHAATSISASTESPPSMVQLLLPQQPYNVYTDHATQLILVAHLKAQVWFW
jgi:hypothetical protein